MQNILTFLKLTHDLTDNKTNEGKGSPWSMDRLGYFSQCHGLTTCNGDNNTDIICSSLLC